MAGDAFSEQKAAIERRRTLELAFVGVFGIDGARTAQQQIVWEWLEHCGFRRRAMIYPSPTGTIDPSQISANAAAHAVVVAIEKLIRAGSLPLNPLTHPQPDSIRDT